MAAADPSQSASGREIDYADQLAQALPQGPAWATAVDSVLRKFLLGIAGEYARIHDRAIDFESEIDPRTTTELLDAWEEFLGLPDDCSIESSDPIVRRAAILAAILDGGGPTPDYFVQLAGRLGYEIEVVEHRPFRMGVSRMGDPLDGEGNPFRMGSRMGDSFDVFNAWEFAVDILTDAVTEHWFRMGSTMGTPLLEIVEALLECVLRRATPAHAELFFIYRSRLRLTPALVSLQVPPPSLALDWEPEEEDMPTNLILAQGSGRWSVGTVLAGVETNPEKFSPLYRTRIDISYTGTTGTVPAADAILSHAAWGGRLISINHVGPGGTAQISLYSGISTGSVGSPVTLTHGAGTLTGVSCGLSEGRTTGYGDTSGKKAPRHSAGSTGYWNAIGSPQDVGFSTSGGAPTFRVPYQPEAYSRLVDVPQGAFGDGGSIEVLINGVWQRTTADTCKLWFALQIGDVHFNTTGIDLANNRVRMFFPSPDLPAIAAEEAWTARIILQSARKDDRTQGLVASLSFRSASLSYDVVLQRGSDKLVSPTTFSGFELENGDDLGVGSGKKDPPNPRSARNLAVWFAAGPQIVTGDALEFHAIALSYQVALRRDERFL